MECIFCKSSELEDALIKEYSYWKIYLHKNQAYLGRCMIALNRHLEDIFDINQQEFNQLFEIIKNLKSVTKELFNVDLFNYASFGNYVKHVHLHFIPRYLKKVNFLGITFEDKTPGKNYAPYDADFKIPKEVKYKIIEKIRSKLI